MIGEPSTTGETSTLGRDEFSWNTIYQIFRLTLEPYLAYINYDHVGVNAIYLRIQSCAPFYKIVTAVPVRFLPKQIVAFFLFLHEPNDKDISTISFHISTDTDN